MEVVPEELESRTFSLVKRGFSPDEVTAYLHELAQGLRESDDFHRAGTEVSTALRDLHDSVTNIREAAERDARETRSAATAKAERTVADAKLQAEGLVTSARQRAEKLTNETTTEAEALRRSARDETDAQKRKAADDKAHSEQMLSQARSDAAAIVGEARRRADAISEEAGARATEKLDAMLEGKHQELIDLQTNITTAAKTLRRLNETLAEVLEYLGESEAQQDGAEVINLTGTSESDRGDAYQQLIDAAVNGARNQGDAGSAPTTRPPTPRRF